MRKSSLALDPFSLIRIGVATWLTDLFVAQKFAQAALEQNALIADAMRGRPLVRSEQIDRPAPADDGAEPDPAGTVGPGGPAKPVRVYGENGGDNALLAVSLPGAPVDAERLPGSVVVSVRPMGGVIFQRTAS